MSRKAGVTSAIASISVMPLAALRIEWERRYGAAPRHRSTELLRRVLAWRVQADVYGGLDATTRKLLAREAYRCGLHRRLACALPENGLAAPMRSS